MKLSLVLFVCGTVGAASCASGETTARARVTQVVKEVNLLGPKPHRTQTANLNDAVADGASVQTGAGARAEISFDDQSLARLGANTVFAINDSGRDLALMNGAVLVRIPKNAGAVKLKAAAVTVAAAGTTSLLDYHKDAYLKLIVLEGTGRIYTRGRIGESVLVRAGQMLIMKPDDPLPDPVDIDIQRLTQTSVFFSKDFRPLTSVPLITGEIDAQHHAKKKGALIDTNLVIFGTGTSVSIVNPTPATSTDAKPKSPHGDRTVTAAPAPSPTPAPTAPQPALPL